MSFDQIDRKILIEVQNDSKQTIKEIAVKLNLSTTPVFERLKRLEKTGYINSYTADINRFKVGLSVMAFCSVSLEKHHSEYLVQFENDVQNLSEVMECYHIAGMFDYLLKVISTDIQSYHEFIAKKLAKLPNIGRVQSSFVMNDVKETRALPIY